MPDPLDLARCRALADEAEESLHSIALLWQEMQAAMRRREPVHPNDIGNDPITVSAKAAELATALRAACDEVERLRGGACRHCGCIKPLEAP